MTSTPRPSTSNLLERCEALRIRAGQAASIEVAMTEDDRPATQVPTLAEAVAQGERGMEVALSGADEMWAGRIELRIRSTLPGDEFIAPDVSAQVTADGYFTESPRAIGAIIKRLSREGIITTTGEYRRARTSNGTMRPVWRRC